MRMGNGGKWQERSLYSCLPHHTTVPRLFITARKSVTNGKSLYHSLPSSED
jgi:hypothetical protein